MLASRPTADVTIDLSSSDPTEGAVSPLSVTFTPTTWNESRTITVIGMDDAEVDGPMGYAVLTTAATSSDPVYASVDAADVSVSNLDNDVAGIVVSPTAGLTTTEAGGTATFTVVLTSQPSAGVTIDLSSSDTGEGTVAPASVTFTAATWNAPQTVTVTGADDSVADGPRAYGIVTAAALSADPGYEDRHASDVVLTNTDDDTAGIVVTPISGLTTSEAGGMATFTVVLTSQPTADVLVGLSSSDTTEGTVAPRRSRSRA